MTTLPEPDVPNEAVVETYNRLATLYDWLFERVSGYERFGCRPIYASRTLEEEGFAIERQEHLHRARVWPVEILIARPI